MSSQAMLSWKGKVESVDGIAVLTFGDLSVTLDLPNFKQANDLVNFIHKVSDRTATARVKQVGALVRGALDVSSNL